ncbi:thiocillin family RiPP [Bacillus velezensis]
MEQQKELELELYAEELTEIQSLAGFTTTATFGTAGCAISSVSSGAPSRLMADKERRQDRTSIK